jgi:hypothetical protein
MAIIKKLPEKFRSFGVFYTLVQRTGNIAIYNLKFSPVSAIVGFNVIKVQCTTLERYNGLFRDTSKQLQGNPGDIIESYPSSLMWERFAWSFDSIPEAREKYFQLTRAEKVKTLVQVMGYEAKAEPKFSIAL